jgi:hypothetical protein
VARSILHDLVDCEFLPLGWPAGSFDHGRDGRAGVVFGGVVMGPDVGVTVAMSCFDPPDLIRFESDVSSAGPAELTIPPAPDQRHHSTVER